MGRLCVITCRILTLRAMAIVGGREREAAAQGNYGRDFVVLILEQMTNENVSNDIATGSRQIETREREK